MGGRWEHDMRSSGEGGELGHGGMELSVCAGLLGYGSGVLIDGKQLSDPSGS